MCGVGKDWVGGQSVIVLQCECSVLLLCVEGDGDEERGCGGMCVGAGDESVCVLYSVCVCPTYSKTSHYHPT